MINRKTLYNALEVRKEKTPTDKHFWRGEHHNFDIDDMEDVCDLIPRGAEYHDYNDMMDKLGDDIMQYADSRCPVYNQDLIEWFSDNWTAVNDHVQEFGHDKEFNIMRVIMEAWVMSYEQDLREAMRILANECE